MTWTVTTFEEEVGLHNEGGFSQLKKKLACIKKEDSCARVHLGKRARGRTQSPWEAWGHFFLPRDVCRGTPFASRSVPTGDTVSLEMRADRGDTFSPRHACRGGCAFLPGESCGGTRGHYPPREACLRVTLFTSGSVLVDVVWPREASPGQHDPAWAEQ